MTPTVQPFFDPRTFTLTFVVSHPETKDAVYFRLPVNLFQPADELGKPVAKE